MGNTSFPVSLTVVQRNPVQFSALRLTNNSALLMTLKGNTGRVYSIVMSTNMSTNLLNWTEVQRVTLTTSPTSFTNTPPANTPRQYFRALEL